MTSPILYFKWQLNNERAFVNSAQISSEWSVISTEAAAWTPAPRPSTTPRSGAARPARPAAPFAQAPPTAWGATPPTTCRTAPASNWSAAKVRQVSRALLAFCTSTPQPPTPQKSAATSQACNLLCPLQPIASVAMEYKGVTNAKPRACMPTKEGCSRILTGLKVILWKSWHFKLICNKLKVIVLSFTVFHQQPLGNLSLKIGVISVCSSSRTPSKCNSILYVF